MIWLLSLFGLLGWGIFLWFSIKNPIYGVPKRLCGGCFGGGDSPEYNPPPAPKIKPASEVMREAKDYGQTNYPWAYGARESALADLARGNDYYSSFSPTSFEEALGSKYFSNVMPDIERSIKQNLSLSGMEYSPLLSSQIATQRGNLGVTIGEYLSNLGNQRALQSLTSRLAIDPYSTYSPYAETDINQSNLQSQYDYESAVARAQADYQNALAEAKQKASKISSIGSLAGMGVGLALAPFTGGMSMALPLMSMGGSLGGTASGLFGGSSTPINFSDALALSRVSPNTFNFSNSGGTVGKGVQNYANNNNIFGSATRVNPFVQSDNPSKYALYSN